VSQQDYAIHYAPLFTTHEFFFVLDGLLRIELAGAAPAELGPRQAFSVPAGMLHRPVAGVRSAVLMIEKAGVVATGD
jgi:mannose-6-phosphate isomerase-like protein (cupin superfamily)